MHLIHALAECYVCKKVWDARNALAVAAQHNQRTGHEVAVELSYSHRFVGPQVKPTASPRRKYRPTPDARSK